MNNNKLSFWELTKNHKITIPVIQRDYAQGRIGKEYLRQNFLSQLIHVLHTNSPLTLDFIYSNEENNTMNPLDGQQRLTTLWLLHWYIAFRLNKLNEHHDEKISEYLMNFSYETRVASKNFCKEICHLTFHPNISLQKGNKRFGIIGYIQQQTWFNSIWKQDPTIQAMLRMLGGSEKKDASGNDIMDGIEEFLSLKNQEELQTYWNRLTGDNCPITFYHLTIDTEQLPLSDDLYIKMNARGRILSDFENLKADWIDWMMNEHISKDTYFDSSKNTSSVCRYQKYSCLLDNKWADIFWENRWPKDGSINEIYFAFINRILTNLICVAKNTNQKFMYEPEKINNGDIKAFDEFYGTFYDGQTKKNDDTRNFYNSFSIYQPWIGFQFLERLEIVLSRLPKNFTELYNKNFIPQYESQQNNEYKNRNGVPIKEIKKITQSERVEVHAIFKYLETGTFDALSFKKWMRITNNLIRNGNINNIESMIGALRLIDELGEHAHNIYQFLADNSQTITSNFIKTQIEEEREKAKRIIASDNMANDKNTWEDIITEAEEYAFFKGAIRFLYSGKNGEIEWENFLTKWENTKELIPINETNRQTITELLSYMDENTLAEVFSKYSLSSKDNNLRAMLLDTNPKTKKCIHHFLMQDTKSPESVLQKDLKRFSNAQNYSNYWIRKDWYHWKYVLTNYTRQRGYYENNSFVIGDSNFEHFISLLQYLSKEGKITDLNDNPLNEFVRGLQIRFKYRSTKFIYFKENSTYKICRISEDGHKLKKEDDSLYECEITIDELLSSLQNKLDELL